MTEQNRSQIRAVNLRKSNLGNFFVGKLPRPSHDLITHKNGLSKKLYPFTRRQLRKDVSIKNLDFCEIVVRASVSLRSRAFSRVDVSWNLLISFNILVHIFSEINSETNKNYTSVMIQLFRWDIRNFRETKRTLAFVNVVLVTSKIEPM